MAKNEIFPACVEYLNKVSDTAVSLKNNNVNNGYVLEEVNELSNLISLMKKNINCLENAIDNANSIKNNTYQEAIVWRDEVLVAMKDLRKVVDILETKVDVKYWPMPTYVDLLFGI